MCRRACIARRGLAPLAEKTRSAFSARVNLTDVASIQALIAADLLQRGPIDRAALRSAQRCAVIDESIFIRRKPDSMRAIQRHRGPSKEEVHRFCASLGEEDGEDPHLVKRRRAHSKRSASSAAPSGRPERKVCQLCRQVALTLDEVLADCGDGVLRGLRVATVSPFPNASRLLVTVAPVGGRLTPDAGPKVVMEHLERASGHLRYEIAAAVTRKRAPLLHYRLAEPALEATLS